jgi:hypothetical protein
MPYASIPFQNLTNCEKIHPPFSPWLPILGNSTLSGVPPHMVKRFLLFSFVSMMVVMIFAVTAAHAFQGHPAQGKLTLVGQPSIIVNPGCNPEGSAKGWVKVRNEGAAGSAPVQLAPTATSLTSKSPQSICRPLP